MSESLAAHFDDVSRKDTSRTSESQVEQQEQNMESGEQRRGFLVMRKSRSSIMI